MARVIEGFLTPPQGRFALCVSRFNGFITEQLLRGAHDALVRHGVADGDIDVFRVPGTFELPGLVRRVTESGQYAGVVALGCVIRGGTPHFEYVAGEVSKGIGQIALSAPCPVSSVDRSVQFSGLALGGATERVPPTRSASMRARS